MTAPGPNILSKEPSVLRSYLRACKRARYPVRTSSKPHLVYERHGISLRSSLSSQLHRLFGSEAAGKEDPGEDPGKEDPGVDGVPLTLPHVLAGGLQLALLTDDEFPLRILGAVHARSTLTQLGPIDQDARYILRVSLADVRNVARGTEHDLLTELIDPRGGPVWQGTSTNLTLDQSAPRPPAKERPPLPVFANEQGFSVPKDIGRRYGAVSGDRNPIHLSRYTARLFGFRRAIAHGMWTIGRALVLMGVPAGEPGLSLKVAFKRPLFLPGAVVLRYEPSIEDEHATTFAIVDPVHETLHAEGVLKRTPVDDDDAA